MQAIGTVDWQDSRQQTADGRTVESGQQTADSRQQDNRQQTGAPETLERGAREGAMGGVTILLPRLLVQYQY